jgi:hypothetical protein
MHRKNANAGNFIIIISGKDAVVDKVPKQPTTHTSTHTQSNKASITTQAMSNDTLLHLGKRHITCTGTGWKTAVSWRLLTSAISGRHGGSSLLV